MTSFDEFVMHVDGWLCEIKDVQIRDGLHVLGQVPEGGELINLVLAILRSPRSSAVRSMGCPACGPRLVCALSLSKRTVVPFDKLRAHFDKLRAHLDRLRAHFDGLRPHLDRLRHLSAQDTLRVTDAVEAQARDLVEALAAEHWSVDAIPQIVERVLRMPNDAAATVLRFACQEVIPRLARTGDEITAILHALDGGYVPAGPSGSPLRGLINVLPTGRNFYSVDGVKVSVFRQQRDARGDWVDEPVDPKTVAELEDKILTKARELRIAGLETTG